MNLLFLSNNSLVSKVDNQKIYFSDTLGGGFFYFNKNLSSIYFNENIFWGVHCLQEKNIEVFLDAGSDWRAIDIAKNVIIKNHGGNIKLDKTIKKMLVYQIMKTESNFIVFKDRKIVGDEEKRILTFYDLNKDTYEDVPAGGWNLQYNNGDFFGFGNSLCILKCDNKFQKKWFFDDRERERERERELEIEPPKSINQNAPKKIINLKESIIVNFACERTKRKLESEEELPNWMNSEPWYINGELLCLNNDTGEANWTTTFPLQIDDIELTDSGNIVVASERFLYVVNPEDGAILDKLDTKIRTSEREEQISITLLNHNGYLFVFSFKDCLMQIFNSETLELLRTIDEKERGWHFARYRPKVFGSQIVVPIQFSLPSINNGAMFIIDTDDIHAEIDVEEQPNFDISIPDKDNKGIITCNVDYPDWSKVLRMIEEPLFDSVFSCSGIDTHKHFSPRKVLINYTGYDADKVEVEEKMQIFKKRFETYIQEPHVPGIAIPPIELEYNLG